MAGFLAVFDPSLPLHLSVSDGWGEWCWRPRFCCLRVSATYPGLGVEVGASSSGIPSADMLPEVGSLWLLRLLRDIQLAQFYRPILEELNVTRPEHFDFVRPEDLDGIGMGRPAQRRLAEALKKHRSGFKSKNWVYKVCILGWG